MIPRNSLNQLYLPGVSGQGGAVTGVVIPAGSGSNGPTVVTYPGGGAEAGEVGAATEEAQLLAALAAAPEVGPLTAMVEKHSQEVRQGE